MRLTKTVTAGNGGLVKVQPKLTLRLLKLVNQVSQGVSGLIHNESLHHTFKKLVKFLLFEVLF
jgi:hypothetical protein